MKKLLYCAAALATLLFAGSCQRENLEPAVEGTTVSYTVTVPGAMATKASDYNGVVDYLVYEVHGAKGKLYQNNAKFENGVANVDIEVVKDQNFTILFWAQKEGVAYGTTDLQAVTMPATLTANVEDYEAFYGKDEFVYETDIALTNAKELTRAVSMLNIGTTAASLNVGGETGNVTLQKSGVTVKGLPNTLNIMTDVATNEANAAYGYTTDDTVNVPAGTLTVGTENYVYVAKNYVGFAAADKSTADVTLTILTDEGTITHEIPSVPFQRNYKTNIVGDLITASASYQVELTDDWNATTLDVVLVKDASGLQEAINEAPEGQKTEIKLDGDIDLNDLFDSLTKSTETASKSLDITAGRNITLDLNGYTLTGVDETNKSFGLINNMGNLTIVNTAATTGKILLIATIDREWNAYSSVISAQPGSTLTVGTGVEIEHLGGTDMAYGIDILTNGKGTSVEVVIDGATVKSTYRAVRQFLNGIEATNKLTVKDGSVIKSMNGNKAIWMQDPSANANTGSLVVEGGAELYGNVYLSVTAGSTEWPVSVSVAASALKGESVVETNSNVPVGYSLKNKDGVYTVEFHPVAMIGEKGYATLSAAVAAVQDGGTITLVADETFTATNYYDNGGWKDGLGYSGDKSFTIDLGGYTIKQDGSLNDYLIWIKNAGAKENTITLKNGTLDAGKTAFCALCTASSHDNKLTVNLENITLINENSNGSTVKIRTGSELNVKAGTKIIGKNSYLGIENWKAVVNIYDGAEIYMNGTSSYNGCLVGVGGNGTINVHGGYGKGVKGGFIAMTSGGTINVAGGEWIANTDGTVGDNSNLYVLTAQSNKYESGFAGPSIINVTGGTLRGGMDAWVLNNLEGEKAELNISGGNFNANPSNYLEDACEATENAGVWTVRVLPAAKIGETEYASLQEAFNVGGNITLLRNVTLDETITLEGKEVVLDLNAKTLTADAVDAFTVNTGGKLTLMNGSVSSHGAIARAVGGEVVIENGTYTQTGTAVDSTPATYRYAIDSREGGKFTVNGGEFNSNNGMISVSADSEVVINDGKFINVVEKTMTRHFAYVSAKLTINGGEFLGKANGNAGGCFFCGAAAGGDIQIKGGKFTSLWTSGSVNRIFEVYYGGTINVTGGMFNTNGGITSFVTANTDDATKVDYPYVAK